MTHPLRAWLTLPLAAMTLLPLPLTAHAQGAASSSAASSDNDLSASQKARMTARRNQLAQAAAALRADTKLTPAQKQAKFALLVKAANKDMMALLTPPQRALMLKQRQIDAQTKSAVDALRADKTLTDAQKQARFETLMHKRQTALLATLGPAQRARVEKEHQAQLARAAQVNSLGEQIQKSESPAQVKEIHDIGLATRAKMQAVIADKTMPDQAKVAKITELRRQAQAKITGLLTPKQREQFDRLQALVSSPMPQ